MTKKIGKEECATKFVKKYKYLHINLWANKHLFIYTQLYLYLYYIFSGQIWRNSTLILERRTRKPMEKIEEIIFHLVIFKIFNTFSNNK